MSHGITPEFNKNIFNYAVIVGENVDSINVTAIPADNKATVTILGNTGLKLGDNTITVCVTAEDKKIVNTYTITVTKAEDSIKSNAYLENIFIENIILTPEFSPEIFEYNLGSIREEKLKISAFPQNENAKVEVIGNENLKLGENIVKVIVTSENGKIQKTYNLKLLRENVEISNLIDVSRNNKKDMFYGIWKAIKEHSAVILLYAFVWIEFLQVVYLYERLKKAENIDVINKENIHEEAYVDKIKGIIKRIKVWKKNK